MAREVLTVIFQQPADFVAQERHLGMGAFFVPAPERLPEPFAELVLRIESPTGEAVELPARAMQISPKGIAVAFDDLGAAKQALAKLFAAARGMPPVEDGATWVFWGRPDAPAEAPAEAPAAAPPLAPTDAAEATDATHDPLLYDQIHAMGTQEKIRLALHGDRASRLILLKDVNKGLQTFLIQNKRITIDEIRYLAGFRQANPEVLNMIAQHRDWGSNAGVISALVRNPKTPGTTAVKLLDKLPLAEVRRLAKTAEAPRAVTIAARRRVATDP